MRAIPPEDMNLQEISASIELDSFCTTLFWNVLQLGQVLVNGSSRLSYYPLQMKFARFELCSFSGFSDVEPVGAK